MSELVQVSSTGNRQKPYSWSSSSKEKSKPSEEATDGSSIEKIYRCNNCNLLAPIEELRTYPAKGASGNHCVYFHKTSSMQHLTNYTRLIFPLDTLLCDSCKILFKEWGRHRGVGENPVQGSRSRRYGSSSLIQFAGKFGVTRIEDWSRQYWRGRFQGRPSENGFLSVSWRGKFRIAPQLAGLIPPHKIYV